MKAWCAVIVKVSESILTDYPEANTFSGYALWDYAWTELVRYQGVHSDFKDIYILVTIALALMCDYTQGTAVSDKCCGDVA